MRKLVILVPVLAIFSAAFGQKNVSLDELIRRADSASVSAQPALCIKIAERELDEADKLYNSGDAEKAQRDVEDAVSYSEKSVNAATQSGSHLKNVEIGLHKMADRLQAIRRTLAFDDQKPVADAADRMENLRTTVLARMFDKGKGKGKAQ
jgi:hypothetical protein